MASVQFFVPGIPRPGGSKKAFVNPKTKRAIVVDAGGDKTKNWRSDVKLFGSQAMSGQEELILCGPLYLSVVFTFPRPESHYHKRKDGNVLKQIAPDYHASKPDTTKLLRSLEDALTGVVWKDDAQVAFQTAKKVYGDTPGAQVLIEDI